MTFKVKAKPIFNPREAPAYTIGEACSYLRIPSATLRSWLVGRPYSTAKGKKQSEPLIALADKKGIRLSFVNLVEAHVLSAVRRHHGVELDNIRRAIKYSEKKFGAKRPLVDQEFATNGVDLFIDHLGLLLNASKDGQLGMKDVLSTYLKRIERDPSGIPIKLFPFTRLSNNLDQPKKIQIDPRISFGRPVISGTGIRTEVLFERFLAGENTKLLAQDYGRSEEEIQEAIRYEQLAA